MKYFLMLFLFSISLFSKDFSMRYDVHVSLLGNVGYAEITLKEKENSYEIKLVANTIGIAAVLLKNRVETFISKGKIVEGRYVPDLFVATKETDRRTRVQTYHFDHDKKEIKFIEEKTKLVTKTRFDSKHFKIISEDVTKNSKEERLLDLYKDGDVLSYYLNTDSTCNSDENSYKLIAVGAHDEKNDITISRLEGLERESAVVNFSEDIKDIYNLNVVPFDKDDEIVDVLIAFDNDGLLKEALLGEVFWVGKITAKRTHHEISYN
ncbi:DUF3108 domain-containing protein [Sulfurimonas sp.]|uniref:DUF3108 domain-containing protein n=1 Tax=Sulfurimonas sp. TaxID=2022749 RepID=UPI0025ECC166|nr:DUF3108 domain-containing protein [Sulfurimonas sp.]MCK9455186.1 DUF3108 domain-containing protein [Sulfurimonas sp.]